MLKQESRQVNSDISKIEGQQRKLGIKVERIIREQEQVTSAADKGIERINSDLSAIRRRLDKYVGKNPAKMDESYFDLKDRYVNKLQERRALEDARTMAQESLTAAKLHMIPGEGRRE